MTPVLTKGDYHARTSEELRARLMALVLAAVLVWYTLVVPPYAPAAVRTRLPDEDEGADGEVRQARGTRALTKGQDLRSEISNPEPPSDVPVEELDWPEYIYP